MNSVCRVLSFSALVLALAACGGGGGSDGTPTTGSGSGGGTSNKTPTQILADAKSSTTSQLNSAAHTLADNAYSGSTSKAELDIALAQQIYRLMFDDNLLIVPEIAEQDISGQLQQNGSINADVSCEISGSVRYDGQFQSNGTGKMTMEFTNCITYSNEFAISGVAAISIDSVDDNDASYSIYFDGLGWEQQDSVSLTGVMVTHESLDMQSGLYSSTESQYIALSIGDESYLVDVEMSGNDNYYNPENQAVGRINIGSRGYVDFSILSQEYNPPYLNNSTFYLNDGEAYLNFVNGSVVYVADTDGDQEKDSGRVEILYSFLDAPITDLTLRPLSELSTAPEVRGVNVVTERPVPSSDIVVEPGYYFDYETPKDELTISYNWYINGALLEDVKGDTLPAYSAGGNDQIYVSLVVSDGTHTTESYLNDVWLQDTPAVLTRTAVPETISSGDTVTFSVVMSDEDVGGDENLAALTVAPEGATLSEDGTVTWHVPENMLFSYQQYTFGFSNKLDPNHHIESSFTLTASSDKAMPLFRTGIEVPSRNKSQWVADFDGDGRNELLSTDNYQRIFLLRLEDGKYQQKWAYPYVISPDQHIIQVLPVDTDVNGTPEILVISEHSMWLIEDLNRPARQIFETEEFLRTSLLADVDNDGVEEIIYRRATDDYSTDTNIIVVAELDDDLTAIHTFHTDGISDMAVGNVDGDSNLELVLNNGMVYDLTSGANEWYLGTGFGDSFVTVGDFNGDGIDEIAGVDNWSNMYVFSAVNKSQLASHAVDDTCDTQAFNLYNDASEELVVGACQWGNVAAYTLNASNQLTMLWQADLQAHGSSSLAMGDIDNDGANEVLWGSGTTSSGADKLVTADITSDSASIKAEATTVQLDSFKASGWSDIYAGDNRAVFMVPSTESGYDGLAVATLTKTGDMTVSSELSTGWRSGIYSVTTDYNNDGAGDIFLPSAGTSEDGFGVYRLNDMTAQWTMTGDDVNQIKAMDVNNDGYVDAIISDGSIIKVLDIQNQVQLASYSFANTIYGFDIAMIDGALTVVVAQYNMLQVLTMGANSFSAQGSFEGISCDSVLIYGEGNSRGVVCKESFAGEYWRTLTLQNGELDNLYSVILDINVADIILDPRDPTRFLVASDNSYYWGSGRSTIHSLTADGRIVWSGPELIGSSSTGSLQAAEQEDGTLEILLGTAYGMYWIH